MYRGGESFASRERITYDLEIIGRVISAHEVYSEDGTMIYRSFLERKLLHICYLERTLIFVNYTAPEQLVFILTDKNKQISLPVGV